MLPRTARGIAAIKIDISFLLIHPRLGRASSAHTGKKV
jgi:hypothetical protein